MGQPITNTFTLEMSLHTIKNQCSRAKTHSHSRAEFVTWHNVCDSTAGIDVGMQISLFHNPNSES